MTTHWSHERLKGFVQETLGCGCPEEVFEEIHVSSHQVEDCSDEITRIVIGNRLLIYVIPPDSENDLSDRIELIGLAGKADRDANLYNRFRLVVSIAEGAARNDHAAKGFSNAFAGDEKMHIHFVREELLVGL